MSKSPKSKQKLFQMYRILHEETDENHKMSGHDLASALGKYGISVERKTIYSDIETLQEMGVDVISEKNGNKNLYYIGERKFQLAELKLLVDAVLCSKFITTKKSNELIEKLGYFTSVYDAKSLTRHVLVDKRIKNDNENILYNVDAIHNAIQDGKKVEFKYFDYNIQKQYVYRNDGRKYSVSPYALTWAEENYYLVAYHEKYSDICNFRVDRMKDISVSEEDIPEEQKMKNFDVAEYSNKIFNMFSGNVEKVQLEFDNELINAVIDRFGKDIDIYQINEDNFNIVTEVEIASTFFSWLVMFGKKVRIVSPTYVADEMKKYLEDILTVY